MTRTTVASVVEGYGEVSALPKLLQRVAKDIGIYSLSTPVPMRVPRSKLVASGGIERAVSAMATEAGVAGAVLVVLDADDDCPARLGPQLLRRAQDARSDMRMAVVLATREFEAWFLAAAPSLAGRHGLPADFDTPPNLETIRDAKGKLSKARIDGHPYRPTVDQAPLASVFDMKMARMNSPSFDKFCRDVARLLGVSPERESAGND